MMKKAFTTTLIAAAMTAAAATAVFADEAAKIEANGIKVEVPGEYKDLLTIQTEDLEVGTLIKVSETASVEAAKKQDPGADGAGWLFSITRVPEDKMKELRCGGMDGKEVFAEDDDMYYVFEHPTDVRFFREQYDNVEEDQAQWTVLNEWAAGEVRQNILRDNPELDAENYTNTVLDMFFARAAYDANTHFMIKSLDYGTMDPATCDENDFIEDLTEDVTFEEVTDEEAPDGEYFVMDFEDEGVRFDFFKAEGKENYIREVYKVGDEEFERLYKATFKDSDKTATGIMRAWCEYMKAAK